MESHLIRQFSCQMCGISQFTNRLCFKVIKLCEVLRQVMSCQVQSLKYRNSLWDIHTCHSKPINVIPGSLVSLVYSWLVSHISHSISGNKTLTFLFAKSKQNVWQGQHVNLFNMWKCHIICYKIFYKIRKLQEYSIISSTRVYIFPI